MEVGLTKHDTNMENDQRISQLEQQVQELLDWKEDRIKQQLTYPLDKESADILQKDLFVFSNLIVFDRANGVANPYALVGSVNNKTTTISVLPNPIIFVASSGADTLTIVSNPFVNDDTVSVLSSNTLPSPLLDGVQYFVVSSTSNTIKLSLTQGGAAIDLTTNGVGIQYINYF